MQSATVTTSPSGFFIFDNIFYPSVDPGIDNDGLLFLGGGLEINIFSNGADSYQFYDNSGYNNVGASFAMGPAPGGGQIAPAKFVFDVNAAPSCTNDFVAIGIPANPASGGQANLVGFNNLYSLQGPCNPALCQLLLPCPDNWRHGDERHECDRSGCAGKRGGGPFGGPESAAFAGRGHDKAKLHDYCFRRFHFERLQRCRPCDHLQQGWEWLWLFVQNPKFTRQRSQFFA